MKLVKFSNGKYGIRRGIFDKEYLDFSFRTEHKRLWWPRCSGYFKDCMTSEEIARKEFEFLKSNKWIDNVKEKVIK